MPCEEGYSCPGGTDRRPCRQGSYQPDASQSDCLSCPKGKYQQEPAKALCVSCPAGYFCPERTVNPIECGSIALFCELNSGTVQAVSEGEITTSQNSKRFYFNLTPFLPPSPHSPLPKVTTLLQKTLTPVRLAKAKHFARLALRALAGRR